VSCAGVRSFLPEHALGVLRGAPASEVEQHLAWCAACRKEAGDLAAAAAVLPFSLAIAPPPPGLEDRIVDAVRRKAHRVRGRSGRGGRLAISAAVAAFVAVAGLGWGAVMAGRAARFQDQATVEHLRSVSAAEEFRRLLLTLEFSNPNDRVQVATLSAPGGGTAGGSAVTLISATGPDQAVVTVTGVAAAADGVVPLRVSLTGARGRAMTLGKIRALDSSGGGRIAATLGEDLALFDRVLVSDANGDVVLRGMLLPAPPPTPSPSASAGSLPPKP